MTVGSSASLTASNGQKTLSPPHPTPPSAITLHLLLKKLRVLSQTAQLLHEKGWLPEVVMSSNSERTRQTLEAMKEAVDAFR